MATKKLQVYKCEHCGNIVEVLTGGNGTLVCCGEPMILLEEQSADASTEKHVPVIEPISEGIKVKVGSVPHPMEDNHYIDWIQVIAGDKAYRKFLSPGESAEAEFSVSESEITLAREHCTVHNLWKK